MPTSTQLENMSQMEVASVEKANLAEIQAVHIDPSQAAIHRMESYLKQIKNPYLFLCDETVVKLRFGEDDKPLAQRLRNYLVGIKKG